MEKKHTRLVAAVLTLVLALSFVFFVTAPVLAQDEGQEQQEKEPARDIPPELQAKVREFREASAELRETGMPVKTDLKKIKRVTMGMFRKARSMPRDARRDLTGRLSTLKEEYAGTVEEKTAAIRETTGAMREAASASREAWEQDNLEGALSGLDQAIAKAAELKPLLEEAHQLLEEILDALRQIAEETRPATASSPAFAT